MFLRRAFLPCILTGFAVLLLSFVGQAQAKKVLLKLSECTSHSLPNERKLMITGSVATIRKAQKVKVTFVLAGKSTANDSPATVPSVNLMPETFDATVNPTLLFTRRVQNLFVNTTYRVKVIARWFDQRGRTLRTEQTTSSPCRQPESRPDIRLQSVTAQPTENPLIADYQIAVTTDFDALFSDDALLILKTLAGSVTVPFSAKTNSVLTETNRILPAQQQLIVTIQQPRCQSNETITVELQIPNWLDRWSQNNRLTQLCMLPVATI